MRLKTKQDAEEHEVLVHLCKASRRVEPNNVLEGIEIHLVQIF